MKKRPEGHEPFMAPPAYGASLGGLQLNLLSADLEAAVRFQRRVLRAEIRYDDPDLVVVDGFGTSWMIHADHTYEEHPLGLVVAGLAERGGGLEIRLHGCDPDAAAEAATTLGFEVFDGPRDQPDHGLREAHIRDADGYMWVPDVPL